MTDIMKLIDDVIDYNASDERPRAALQAAIEALQGEVERLKADYENLMHGPLGKKEYEELSYRLQHERDIEAEMRDKAEAERDALQSKLDELQRQEPVAKFIASQESLTPEMQQALNSMPYTSTEVTKALEPTP